MAEKTFTAEFFAKQGRRGGRKSSDAMTAEQKKQRAKKAARARWDKKKSKSK